MTRLAPLLAGAALLFTVGIGWGLPSRSADAFLFGNGQTVPWSGQRILSLAGEGDAGADRAADVSSRPLDRREHAIEVNATDRDRARIVRRYRLMSYQPDEFTTFKSLSEMKVGRGDLDPRMYKYGGLWVYPVGGLLKAASVLGLVRLTPDAAYYLDHPEAFGRFYIVARLYSALWGLVGVVAVFLLVRHIIGNNGPATWAAICFMLMPVVVTAAHEAKPHLAGTALILLAVWAAARWVGSGRRRGAIVTAILCGAAIGMVPSTLPVLLVLPAMWALRASLHGSAERSAGPNVLREGESGAALRSARGVGGMLGLVAIALLVYCMTNPYVPINLVRNRAVLRSNFGNSADFYHTGLSGIGNALLLVGLGTSFILALAGGAGGIALGVRAMRTRAAVDPAEARRRAGGVLLAVATLPVGAAFFLFASGQPADYARFALPFDVLLAVEAVVAVATFVRSPVGRFAGYGTLVVTTALMGLQYAGGFVRDARPQTSRIVAAGRIAGLLNSRGPVLASAEEPAPWSLPPVDLFRWRIVLPPRDFPSDRPFPGAKVAAGPADFPLGSRARRWFLSTPISWADKSFSIRVTGGDARPNAAPRDGAEPDPVRPDGPPVAGPHGVR